MDYTNSFLTRTFPIYGADGLEILSDAKVSMSGLGGVGGLAFLALVRSGVGHFKITDGGIFDPPDMNRQALASNASMDMEKVKAYANYAYDINPNVEIEEFETGLTLSNVDEFMDGCDVFMRAMDYGKDREVKDRTVELVDECNVPMFQGVTVGTSAIIHNYKPGGMKIHEFWKLLLEKRDKTTPYLFTKTIDERYLSSFNRGESPTTTIGAQLTSILVASEVLVYLLRDTDLVEREALFTPDFMMFDPFQMKMKVEDINKL